MPELPEVQTVVTGLRPKVIGRVIQRVQMNRTDIVSPAEIDLPPMLTGREITSVERRAKRIVFTLDNRSQFYVHLGMTGQLTIEPATADLRNHTHMVIHLAGTPAEQIRFRDPRRFGGVFWLGIDPATEKNLGPEPLTLSAKRLAAQLINTRRAVKVALLDQKLIAGIGNIYADEALFEAKIHPQTLTHTLTFTQVRALNLAIKKVLRKAIKFRGSTLRDFVDAEGVVGAYRSRHKVYDREGEPCPRCKKHKIIRIVLGGRSTCFCAVCQPGN